MAGIPETAGLCRSCVHARRVLTARGSVYVLCHLSVRYSRFAKYPRLPVLTCSGYFSTSHGNRSMPDQQ